MANAKQRYYDNMRRLRKAAQNHSVKTGLAVLTPKGVATPAKKLKIMYSNLYTAAKLQYVEGVTAWLQTIPDLAIVESKIKQTPEFVKNYPSNADLLNDEYFNTDCIVVCVKIPYADNGCRMEHITLSFTTTGKSFNMWKVDTSYTNGWRQFGFGIAHGQTKRFLKEISDTFPIINAPKVKVTKPRKTTKK